MFSPLVKAATIRFGIDASKATLIVHMLLAYVTDQDTGGLNGFMDKLKSIGAGAVAQSWLGGTATTAQLIGTGYVQQALGGSSGLIGAIGDTLGVGRGTAATVAAFLLPGLIGKLTPHGTVSNVLPQEVSGFLAAVPAKSTCGCPVKWVLGVLVFIVAVLMLRYCSEPVAVTTESPVAVIPAIVKPVAPAIPLGAGALATISNGAPALKVYFETGKAAIATEFGESAKPLVAYLKENPDVKAVVSGFSDPTGSLAVNEEMSKQRAMAVADALKAAGVADASIVLEKPADITGSGDSNAESRRVEVVIRK